MAWYNQLGESEFGRIIRGIIKIAIAPVVYALLSGISWSLANVDLGGQTVNLQILIDIVKVFGPIGLIYSGLKDIGIDLF